MEIIKGQVVKITTTKDQCIRLTVDIEKGFVPKEVNVINWQDCMVLLQKEDE